MDTFDGIFAGKKKRLKAMKDSKVGSFGVQSLVFITLIQIACILKIQNLIIFVLPICLFWGRFSNLFFIDKFKYISYKKKSISHKKFWNGFKKESLISIIFLLIFIAYMFFSITSQGILIKFLILILIGIFLSYSIPRILGQKIGGFNGDACGARWLLEFGEGTLSKIPVAGAVYKTLKQLLETFLSNKSNRFRRVVLVEYPREGLFSVGFVTGDVGPSLQSELNEKLLSVFIPTAPNPTTGWYTLVPESSVKDLDISVEDAFKTIISVGIVNPDEKNSSSNPTFSKLFSQLRASTNTSST